MALSFKLAIYIKKENFKLKKLCIFLEFWTSDRVEAFLSNVSNENMIILDLYSEVTPLWQKFKSYFGKPFIWCMLHNFGGTRCIYGNLDSIAINPVSARTTPGSTMIGIGITPEAIEHNPVVYDLMVSDISYLST